MSALLGFAYGLSLAGLGTLAVLIRELRRYDSPPILMRLATLVGVLGLTSVMLRALPVFTT